MTTEELQMLKDLTDVVAALQKMLGDHNEVLQNIVRRIEELEKVALDHQRLG